ncbi:uncharacterized protein LOC115339608 isoform X2 [Aquila chrysaetos chrysaetos]|uniref:uncharacterized protein LOC115339608 isoform X2 n=1 Tax=Aquila chrysaetos chrysaetos TaxID=223781 RepID=UPI001B7D3C4C|nr:uncharacterized protein LOC115339608 isoform X2 [Aquila chrysaetos chrysaetos]
MATGPRRVGAGRRGLPGDRAGGSAGIPGTSAEGLGERNRCPRGVRGRGGLPPAACRELSCWGAELAAGRVTSRGVPGAVVCRRRAAGLCVPGRAGSCSVRGLGCRAAALLSGGCGARCSSVAGFAWSPAGFPLRPLPPPPPRRACAPCCAWGAAHARSCRRGPRCRPAGNGDAVPAGWCRRARCCRPVRKRRGRPVRAGPARKARDGSAAPGHAPPPGCSLPPPLLPPPRGRGAELQRGRRCCCRCCSVAACRARFPVVGEGQGRR